MAFGLPCFAPRREFQVIQFNPKFPKTNYLDTLLVLTCKNGHSLHMIAGKSHLLRRAAWNWNGIQNTARIKSAKARFPIQMFITVFIRLPESRKKDEFNTEQLNENFSQRLLQFLECIQNFSKSLKRDFLILKTPQAVYCFKTATFVIGTSWQATFIDFCS